MSHGRAAISSRPVVTALLVLSALSVSAGCGHGNESPLSGRSGPAPEQTPRPSADPETYAWEPLQPAPGSFVLRDRRSGSIFNLRGEAIAGPLAEKKLFLRQLPGVNMFWFAWSVFHPGSEVWGRAEKVRGATLPATKNGSPACGGGRDCIPSLPNVGEPKGELSWVRPDAPDARYLGDDATILGVFFDGVARAYPHNILWWHEIANDRIGDRRISVTFCPLTGSGMAFDATERGYTFGVSGNLFNSNLVMYDHQTRSLWPQLWGAAVSGSAGETRASLVPLPMSEMSWVKWRELHPDTLVLGERTGFSRDYRLYPYDDYATDHDTTFRETKPAPDPIYPNKAMTFGLVEASSGAARAYVHADLAAATGGQGVVRDLFAGRPVAIIYDAAARLVIVFDARTAEGELELEAARF